MSSAAKPKVLLLGTIDNANAKEYWDSLASTADHITPKATNRAEFIEECKSGCLDGVLAIYRTFASVDITGRIDEEICQALPKSVKYICHNGAGYDQISIPACTTHHISVSHVPTAVNSATADTAAFLILGALRRFNAPLLALRAGHWRGTPPPPLGHDPQGKVLGILGMGGIGRNLAGKMRAFGMEVVYHNRKRLSAEEEDGARYVGFEELLGMSDVVSLNLPLNERTRGLVGEREFARMKRGVVIVNTARGAVLDEAALVKALQEGRVGCVGLDVFEEEPAVHEGLRRDERVLLLPHMGTWTVETQEAMERWNIDNVRSVLETGKLKSRVHEQQDMPYQ